MAIRLRRPEPDTTARLLAEAADHPLTYEPVGVSLTQDVPAGFRRHRWATVLTGPQAFEQAAAAIRDWEVQRGSGLELEADGPLAVGTHVVIAAPLPIGWVDVVCRVVHLIDEVDRYGFAYGTLPIHPEQGEEAFVVARDAHGRTTFTVDAVSRSAYRLGRLIPFVNDRLQDRANRRYLDAIRHATLL
jgi:uncharacterized protein (UPF0548 family)